MKLENITIAYSNRMNRNKSLLTKKELKNCIKDKKFIPIVDNFKTDKVIGMTTDIRI